MSFILPDLVIESIIRDGIENMIQRPEVLDDVFAEFTKSYNQRKYGAAEIQKIKDLLAKRQIAVVHSFHEAAAKSPCFSIQLGTDSEDKRLAHLDDFEADVQEPITDPDELLNLVKITGLVPMAYDAPSGKVSVLDSVDLSLVHKQYIYVDGSQNEHRLTGNISNVVGDKFFFIEPNADSIDIVNPGEVKSFLDYFQYELRGVIHDVQILVGVHTKEALLTKYLYILLKYFLLSRKKDLIKRCFIVASLSGSDFTRDFAYQGDMVFTRFLTVTGKVEDHWNSNQVDLVDHVDITATPVCDDGDEDDE